MAHKETMRLPAKHAWGVAVFCILLALQASFRFWDGPERSFHDLASTSLTHPAGLPLALVAIDDASLSAVGPWPWSRTTLAQLIDTLSRAKPKAIVVALPAVASQAERSMFTLQSLKDLLANAHDTAASSPAAATDIPSDRLAPIAALVDKAMASAQDNVRWEQSLQSAGNVLLVPSEALPGALSKSQELSYQVPQMVSCLDVLQAKVPAANFTDKVVLVGLTSKSKQGSQDGLTAAAFWPLESLAPAAASLMQIQTTPEPLWGIWFTFATTLAVILFMALGVPNLPSGAVIALCLVAGAGFLALEFCLIAWAHVWLRMVFPALLLGIILLLQLLHRFSPRRMKTVSAATAPEQTDRMMGLALQGQGQLDMAFERFQRIPMDDVVAADLYWLAMEYQRLLRFENATAVYQYIARYAPDFKDVRARLSDPTSTNVPAQSTKASTDLVMGQSNESNQVPRAALGRYRIEKPLGKGAMGVVYLGKDPKIGRQVAIKTMALSQEFDGLELADARDRFFREAKAAGRLQHPGIVTIFDVGEEADLGFIAMEYVTGQDLKAFCKPGQLMPVPRVVSIVARVAQALAHAHRQQVIHRDIKPGNVMYDLVTDTVKITDFGIARITDGNKTRTGIVLGSPSYMAPEQLAGLTLDGRSDLYALGAMLFQLLTGVLPFRAETLADLMAKIANEPAPDVRQLRGDISEELARIVGRLLEKLPEKRYQDGESLASDLYSYAERVQSRVAPLTPKSAPVPAKSLDLEL